MSSISSNIDNQYINMTVPNKRIRKKITTFQQICGYTEIIRINNTRISLKKYLKNIEKRILEDKIFLSYPNEK